MTRNDYVCCLAGAAVAICSTPNKGGTWAGAVKNLDKGWVPLWLKRNADPKSGESHLQRKGGRWLPEGAFRVDTLLSPAKKSSPSNPDQEAEWPQVEQEAPAPVPQQLFPMDESDDCGLAC